MPARFQSGDELHQGIHVATDDALARLHALDGGQGELGGLGQRALVHAEKRAGGAELGSGYHGQNVNN